MKIMTTMCAQGDVCFRRVDKMPEGAKREKRKGPIVVAHSETGHDHTVEGDDIVRFEVKDPFICYLRIDGDWADVIHHRPFDTHAPLRLEGKGAIWEVRRQEEWTPEGWRTISD